MRRAALLALLILLAAPAVAAAHVERHDLRYAGREQPCGGAAITPTQVVTGSFPAALQGSYVMVPFTVPPGTTQVRVKYCYDQPESELAASNHTLDLGLWDARRDSTAAWEEGDFRGWGGSSHPDVQITPQGFAPGYAPDKRQNTPGFTTRGYVPGPVPAGQWAAELGVAAVVPADQGDATGEVAWRLEIELSTNPAFDDAPYEPARYDETPARAGSGWYQGDFHVHAEHSALGDATMAEAFGYAFGKAGLDFITLSDYVTPSGWGEIGRLQDAHRGKLVVRSAEVITYQGHINNHGSLSYVDHRTGAVLERLPDGSLREQRRPRPAADVLRAIRERGGFTQINHPTIFPSAVPAFALLCRGCPWDYSAARTDYRLVDAIEVSTGPAGLQQMELGPNPFTPLAIDFYDRAIRAGHRIAAVGSSDSHNAGRTNNPLTQSPIGQATTVVHADELSEEGVRRAIRRRHSYVKLYGAHGPDVRLEAALGDGRPPAIMGDVVRATSTTFTVRVLGADATRTLTLSRNGVAVAVLPVTGPEFRATVPSAGQGAYRLTLQRGTTIEAISSPIFLDADAPPEDFGDGLARGGPNHVELQSARVRFRRGRATVRCAARGYGLRTCDVRLRARGRTVAKGRAPLRGGEAAVRLRLTRAGRAARRLTRATAVVRALGDRGTVGPVTRRVRVRR